MKRCRMRNKFAVFLLIALISLGFKCDKKEEDRYGGIAEGTYRGFIRDTGHQTTSPQGLRIDGYNAVNAAYIPEYDSGATELFDLVKAAPYNYTSHVSHTDYKFYVFPRSRYCEGPGFAIPGGWNAWDQTEFDKDPRVDHTLICAAGLNFGYDTMVVADDISIARTIARYELEHFMLYYNDQDWYSRTVGVHQHPIFGQNAVAFKPPFGKLDTYTVPENFGPAKKGNIVFIWLVK
jgi:hypothetical protein